MAHGMANEETPIVGNLTITIKILKKINPLIQQSHFWEFIPQNLQEQNDIGTSLVYKREETPKNLQKRKG